jgi:cobyrinic acid a,c-diamide synthase
MGPTVPVLVIAGAASGVGKTTVTLGLLETLRRRGLAVQAFKVGPDFIDPAFHAVATGRPSYNLDGWLCSRDRVLETVARRAADADVAIVEGVMGCYDGLDGASEAGSTAQVAKWLAAPVVLVVDAGAMARSAAAVVLGFERFDTEVEVGAVVWNRTGGAAHRRWLADALGQVSRARIAGALPHDDALAMPERHLGLVTAGEGGYPASRRAALAAMVERHVNVDALLGIARSRVARARPASRAAIDPIATIAVARDEAFQFYYQENLDLLAAAGARLAPWSPLRDEVLPDADALYIGGGYPELHAGRLSGNTAMRSRIRAFAESGRPIYAECGGLMYLAESLVDGAGARWPMVGVLPAAVTMQAGLLTLGYREVVTRSPGLLGPAGTRVRGQEFHCSTLGPVPASVARVYAASDGQGGNAREEGYAVCGALMSYVHLHLGSNPEVARSFVAACARRR